MSGFRRECKYCIRTTLLHLLCVRTKKTKESVNEKIRVLSSSYVVILTQATFESASRALAWRDSFSSPGKEAADEVRALR